MEPYYLLAGGYDTKNVGDYAMLQFLQRLLGEEGCALKLLSRHQHTQLRELYGVVEIVRNYEYASRAESEGKFFRGLNYGDSTEHLQMIVQQLQASRGLIIGGGRLLIDFTLDVMRGPLPYFATLVTLCRFLGVPVYIYAMTIVPNRTSEGNKWLRFIIDNATRAALRDDESVTFLRSVGCRLDEILVIPDPAFGLDWPRAEGVFSSQLVGLSVRPISRRWGGLSEADYIEKMAVVVETLFNAGLNVIGIPHQFYGVDDPEYDDRHLLEQISRWVAFDYVKDEILDLNQFRELYRSLGLFVGIRRHSFVFAALSGVPILPFAENPNASRICAQMETISPLALDCKISEFQEVLNRVLTQKKQILESQNAAVQKVAGNLRRRYRDWLFGR